MKKCFGYVRVSTTKQGEGVSLEAQKEAIERFAAANDIVITKWFEERETAAKSGRPTFNGMLKALRRGKAAGVVMHKIDRSARNFGDWAKIGELADAGIDIHFATESLDFRSRGGRLSADIQAVIAADYIRNLREEVKKGVTGRLQQGLYPLGAPIGYLDNGGGKPKTLDPERAPLVKQAFELYATRQYSIRSLLVELNRLGLRNRRGKPLSKGGLETILGNPFYTGVIRIRTTGATYRGVHEPLIPVSLFEAVQAVKSGKAAKKVTRHRHTYRGLFQCGHCGLSMIPERQRGHVYYRCQTATCPSNCIREEGLEAAVETALRQIELTDEYIDAIEASVERWLAEDPDNDAKTYKLQLARLESRLEQLTDALIDRLIDQDTFSRRKERLLLEQADLEQRLARHRDAEASPQMVRRLLERLKSLAEHYVSALPDEKREIVEIAVSNRTVWDKKVYLELSDWLQTAQHAISVLCGVQHLSTPRSSPSFGKCDAELLVNTVCSEATSNALSRLMNEPEHS